MDKKAISVRTRSVSSWSSEEAEDYSEDDFHPSPSSPDTTGPPTTLPVDLDVQPTLMADLQGAAQTTEERVNQPPEVFTPSTGAPHAGAEGCHPSCTTAKGPESEPTHLTTSDDFLTTVATVSTSTTSRPATTELPEPPFETTRFDKDK